MTTMELKARKMDLLELLLQLDNVQLTKAEKYIHKLVGQESSHIQTYNMSQDLLNALLEKAEENKKKGNYIEEEDMNNYINTLL